MPFDPAKFGKWAHKALQLDPATVRRARKLVALYLRPGTEGERAAARARLAVISDRANVPLETLMSFLQ